MTTEKKTRYKSAVGLAYNEKEQQTPTLGIKGDNLVADEIVKIANRFGIPVVENASLAQSLKSLEIDAEIPEELFEAVALLLHQIDKKLKKK